MNGYELTRQWYSFAFKNKRIVKPIHHAVIHWIFEKANQSEWAEEFQFPTQEACEMLGISDKNTFLKALSQLVEFGAVTIIEESQNRFNARWISINNCEMYRMEKSHATTYANQYSKPDATTYAKPQATTTNIKPKETNKPNKPINIDFIIFWDLYDNKVDKAKSEKKWNSLKDSERQAAIEDIPKYLESLDDRKYQKNPHTYLNGKCWLDERRALPQAQSQKNNLDPSKYHPNGLPRLVI